ncbi:MAG TPA: aspartyl protease family protein, partial [Polyangiaceae bacterium]|nr:aspartyl protease family protein [Polyangiaceae bacterium]
LDFREPSLWLEGPAPRPRVATPPSTFCRSPVGRLDNLLFLTPVTIGQNVARMTLDSGAGATQLNESSTAGRQALRESAPTPVRAQGLSGRAVSLRVLENATVRLGSAERRADVFVANVGASYCAGEGRLGMDVLRSCRVGLGRAHFSISCLPGD